MRCASCNRILNDFETTRKSATTGKYLDLCNGCFKYIDREIDVIVRRDLQHEEEFDESEFWENE